MLFKCKSTDIFINKMLKIDKEEMSEKVKK